MKKMSIICIGEILWDSVPLGLFLGGAPFNVAYHLNKLGADVKIVSCVGDDELGHEAIKRTSANGMSTDLIQINLHQVYSSLKMADFLKVNTEELTQLKKWFGLPSKDKLAIKELLEIFQIECIAITRGAEGVEFYSGSDYIESEGYQIEVMDTVGAGDAFLAALITGYINQRSMKESLLLANKLGAFVAACYGGTPHYTLQELTDIESLLN